LGGLYLRVMVGSFEGGTPDGPATTERKPLSTTESRTLIVLAVTSVLWLTDTVHGMSPAIPALLAAIVLLCPRIGVLPWKTFQSKLSWGLILTVGASMSLARMMTETGAAAWLGQAFVGQFVGLAGLPLVVIMMLVVMVALVHLAITNLAACIALLLPIATTI